jgi:hypothetical protein
MYCDVEVEEDVWIRQQLERGDLIIVPKGRTFRYTTTPKVKFCLHNTYSTFRTLSACNALLNAPTEIKDRKLWVLFEHIRHASHIIPFLCS